MVRFLQKNSILNILDSEVDQSHTTFCLGIGSALPLGEAANDGQAAVGDMNPLLFFSCAI